MPSTSQDRQETTRWTSSPESEGSAQHSVAPTTHILAISDLHLGHTLKRGSDHVPGRVPPIDRSLGAFLDFYRTHRENETPWRLVIVGDMVDFIAITRTPRDNELVPFSVTDDEREYGLGTEPEKALWKLERVLDLHACFCKHLARFLAEGNDLVIVRGNHDPEWAWPELRSCFRERIARLACPDEADTAARELLENRIHFRDWFYLEPGRFYAEHGHFYDEYSITGDLTAAPRRRDGRRRLSEPVSTLAQRYFANKHTTLDMNEVERWSLTDFLRWGYQSGNILSIFGDYLLMCGRVLAFSIRTSLSGTWRSFAAAASRRPRARETVEQGTGIGLTRALVALRHPPAERSLLKTARMLYFDRLLLILGSGMLVGGCAAWAGSTSLRIGAILGVTTSSVLTNAWLKRVRLVDSHPKLIKAAQRVAEIFHVPIVVMGHSHRLVDQPVGESRYYNLGTWMTAVRRSTSDAWFPHLVVDESGHSMRRWPVSTVAENNSGLPLHEGSPPSSSSF